MKLRGKLFKSRGFVVMSLTLMLVLVGTVNYNLSKKSLLEVSKEMEKYEEAQLTKNDEKKDKKEDTKVVDSKTNEVKEKAKETSSQINKQISSDKNMKKASYVLDMKMNREKTRNSLVEELNEIVNNPSTSEEVRKEASTMKLQLVKDQELELKIEDLLSAKGFKNALVYISQGNANIVVSQDKLDNTDAAKIFDLVATQGSIVHENIKLINNNK